MLRHRRLPFLPLRLLLLRLIRLLQPVTQRQLRRPRRRMIPFLSTLLLQPPPPPPHIAVTNIIVIHRRPGLICWILIIMIEECVSRRVSRDEILAEIVQWIQRVPKAFVS